MGADTPAKPQQHGYEEGPYDSNDKGPYGEGPEHKGYDDSYKYGGDSHVEETSLCLQLINEDDLGGGEYLDTFRCCKPQDAADYCVHNSTYGYEGEDSYKNKYPSDSVLDDLVHQDVGVACRIKALEDPCPAEIKGCLSVWQYNCTIAKHACGCSIEKDLTLHINVYETTCPAGECLGSADVEKRKALGKKAGKAGKQAASSRVHPMKNTVTTPTDALPYLVIAHKYSGPISSIKTDYGYEVVKGYLENYFGWDLLSDDDGNLVVLDDHHLTYPFVKDNSLFIKLYQKKYEYST